MYTARDKLGLLGALAAVAALVWVGLRLTHHSTAAATTRPTSASVPSTSPTAPSDGQTTSTVVTAAQRLEVQRYFTTLRRIDAPTEPLVRQAPITLRQLSLKQYSPEWDVAGTQFAHLTQVLTSAAHAVKVLHAPPGFQSAQHNLSLYYSDEAEIMDGVSQYLLGHDPTLLDAYAPKIQDGSHFLGVNFSAFQVKFKAAATRYNLQVPAWVPRIGKATSSL